MKISISLFNIVLFIYACNSTSDKEPKHSIIGEWDIHDTYNGKPYEYVARFKPDGSFDALSNGKLFVSGKYRTHGDTIFFQDAICDLDYTGIYKFTYFKDSVRFNVFQDTCKMRLNGTNNVAFKKVVR